MTTSVVLEVSALLSLWTCTVQPPYFIRVYFWRHTLHMKACCVRYGKGVLYLGVKRIIPMSRFGIGSNYQYWFISTEFYRYWLLPVNSPIVVYIRKHMFPRKVMIATLLGSFSVTFFTHIIQDTVRK